MDNPFLGKTDKEMLVDWWIHEVFARDLAHGAEIHVKTGETYEPEINGPPVEKRLVFRSKV